MTNLVLNGDLVPTITLQDVSLIHGATFRASDNKCVLTGGNQSVVATVAGLIAGHAYKLNVSGVAELLNAGLRVRVSPTTSGTGTDIHSDFTLSAEGDSGDLYFTATGSEIGLVLTLTAMDETATAWHAAFGALSITE